MDKLSTNGQNDRESPPLLALEKQKIPMLMCVYLGELDRIVGLTAAIGDGQISDSPLLALEFQCQFLCKKRRTNRWEIGAGPPLTDGRDGRPSTDRCSNSSSWLPRLRMPSWAKANPVLGEPASRKPRARAEPKPRLSMPFSNPKKFEPASRKPTARAEPQPRTSNPFTNPTQAESTSRKPRTRAEPKPSSEHAVFESNASQISTPALNGKSGNRTEADRPDNGKTDLATNGQSAAKTNPVAKQIWEELFLARGKRQADPLTAFVAELGKGAANAYQYMHGKIVDGAKANPEQAEPASRKRTARVETEPQPMLSMPFTNPKQAEPASRKPMTRERKRNRGRAT
ncbi:hypothetical protein niasHT_009139 [Heterodera trifolii]|uniref:Uncharacterized protein n=1 Tax=Heterodera trifolii TaxID=157864 RepID=A0ABD2M8W7_9BILA